MDMGYKRSILPLETNLYIFISPININGRNINASNAAHCNSSYGETGVVFQDTDCILMPTRSII